MIDNLGIFYAIILIGFVVLVVFACVALYRAIMVMGEFERTLNRVNEIVDTIEGAVSKVVPTVTLLTSLLDGLTGYFGKIIKSKVSRSKKSGG